MDQWNDNEPIYWQLRRIVLGQILNGALPEGEAVPSVRAVAGQERINPLTVSKAYQTLADDGLLEKRRGLGLFVTAGAREAALKQERERFLKDQWPATCALIQTLGLDLHELLDARSSPQSGAPPPPKQERQGERGAYSDSKPNDSKPNDSKQGEDQ